MKDGKKSRYEIVASAEGHSRIVRELSDRQAKFLEEIFEDLVNSGEDYCPNLYLRKLDS